MVLLKMLWQRLHPDSEQELCVMQMLEQNLGLLDLSQALGRHETYQEEDPNHLV
jgi:hypothetical protein